MKGAIGERARLSLQLPPALSSLGCQVYLSLLLGVSVNSFLFLWHRPMHRRARCSDFAMRGMQRHYACAARTLLGTDEQPDPLCPSTTTSGRRSRDDDRLHGLFHRFYRLPPSSRRSNYRHGVTRSRSPATTRRLFLPPLRPPSLAADTCPRNLSDRFDNSHFTPWNGEPIAKISSTTAINVASSLSCRAAPRPNNICQPGLANVSSQG